MGIRALTAFNSKPAVPALVLIAFFCEGCYLCHLFRVVLSPHSPPWCSPVVPWNQSWLLPSTSYPGQPLQFPSRVQKWWQIYLRGNTLFRHLQPLPLALPNPACRPATWLLSFGKRSSFSTLGEHQHFLSPWFGRSRRNYFSSDCCTSGQLWRLLHFFSIPLILHAYLNIHNNITTCFRVAWRSLNQYLILVPM